MVVCRLNKVGAYLVIQLFALPLPKEERLIVVFIMPSSRFGLNLGSGSFMEGGLIEFLVEMFSLRHILSLSLSLHMCEFAYLVHTFPI